MAIVVRITAVVAAWAALAVAVAAQAAPDAHPASPATASSNSAAAAAPGATLDASSAAKVAQAVADQIKGSRVIAVNPNGSMRSIFPERAYVIAEPVRYEELRIGDIVVYEYPKLHATVVHRVLEKRGDLFWGRTGQNDGAMIARESGLMRVFTIIYVREPEVAPGTRADPKNQSHAAVPAKGVGAQKG